MTEQQTHRARQNGGKLSAAKAAQRGLEQIGQLTNKPTECVTRVEPDDDGWTIGVEVVEDERVPSSSDMMAIYLAALDASGDLISYRRVRRYRRSAVDGSDDGGS